jgi:glutaminyl-tRNA synthetase
LAAEGEAGLGLAAAPFTQLLVMESKGELSATQSKTVLSALVAAAGSDPATLAREMGFEALGADTLAAAVAEVVEAHPDEWARYLAGDDKVTGLFIKEVIDATTKKANGKEVAAELKRLRG